MAKICLAWNPKITRRFSFEIALTILKIIESNVFSGFSRFGKVNSFLFQVCCLMIAQYFPTLFFARNYFYSVHPLYFIQLFQKNTLSRFEFFFAFRRTFEPDIFPFLLGDFEKAGFLFFVLNFNLYFLIMTWVTDRLVFQRFDKRSIIVVNSYFRDNLALAFVLKGSFLCFGVFEVLHDPGSYIFLMDFYISHSGLDIFSLGLVVALNLTVSERDKSESTAIPLAMMNDGLVLIGICLWMMVCCFFR